MFIQPILLVLFAGLDSDAIGWHKKTQCMRSLNWTEHNFLGSKQIDHNVFREHNIHIMLFFLWLQGKRRMQAASHSNGSWSAHHYFECKTHVNVWVGVKRIAERVSMSQYENAQSVHLQEHLIRHAPTNLFSILSLSPSLQPHSLVIFYLQALILFYTN